MSLQKRQKTVIFSQVLQFLDNLGYFGIENIVI